MRRTFTLDELSGFFRDLIDRYLGWATILIDWQQRRDASIRALAFPFAGYRPGQRPMAVEVYRTIRSGEQFIVEAATGIGKTMAVVFPAVKALAEGLTSKIFYLTARTTARSAAEKALDLIANDLLIEALYGGQYRVAPAVLGLLAAAAGLRLIRAVPSTALMALERTRPLFLSNLPRLVTLPVALAAVALGGGLAGRDPPSGVGALRGQSHAAGPCQQQQHRRQRQELPWPCPPPRHPSSAGPPRRTPRAWCPPTRRSSSGSTRWARCRS